MTFRYFFEDFTPGWSYQSPARSLSRDEIERMMYGWSVLCCLATGMAEQPSAATGTVMRADTLRRYATEAGFGTVDVLPIENDLFRFYLLRP